MSDTNKLSLKVMMNQEKTKVFYAESDNDFVDILLSFLTLPLGRIIKLLNNHFGDDKVPKIGSLSSLYRSLANLDAAHFVTEAAKQVLLNPTSSFEAEYERLKLDIADFEAAEYFYCGRGRNRHCRFRSVSVYYDEIGHCKCKGVMRKEVVGKRSELAAFSDGVFTKTKASFVICDDLRIFPNERRILEIIGFIEEIDVDEAEAVNVELGFDEIMKLLKASLTSPTPLSDVILNKTTQMNYSTIMESHHTRQDNPSSWNSVLRLIVQKSTGNLLYARAKEEFVEFLFSLLFIPLGRVGNLLGGKTCFKAINSLYESATHLIDDEYFKTTDTKERLTRPNVVHGCICKNHILPLTEEGLPDSYTEDLLSFSSVKFPEGQGSYLKRGRTYEVKDDLSVALSCFASYLAGLKEQKIPLSDLEEVELKIGFEEALSILKGTLASTCALSETLLSHMSNKNSNLASTSALCESRLIHMASKKPKREIGV